MIIVFGPLGQLWSRDAVCAPVRPGTKLRHDIVDGVVHQAPWWVPHSYKDWLFNQLCDGRPYTRLQWSGSQLVVRHIVGGRGSTVLLSRKVPSVTIKANQVQLVDQRGKIETLQAPWTWMLTAAAGVEGESQNKNS